MAFGLITNFQTKAITPQTKGFILWGTIFTSAFIIQKNIRKIGKNINQTNIRAKDLAFNSIDGVSLITLAVSGYYLYKTYYSK